MEVPHAWQVSECGVFKLPDATDKNTDPEPVKITNAPVWVTAQSDADEEWGMHIEFVDKNKNVKRHFIKAGDLIDKPRRVAASLANLGLSLIPKKYPLLIDFLSEFNPQGRVHSYTEDDLLIIQSIREFYIKKSTQFEDIAGDEKFRGDRLGFFSKKSDLISFTKESLQQSAPDWTLRKISKALRKSEILFTHDSQNAAKITTPMGRVRLHTLYRDRLFSYGEPVEPAVEPAVEGAPAHVPVRPRSVDNSSAYARASRGG